MDETILEKVDEINEALEESFGAMQIDPSAQTMEETLADMRRSMSANAAAMMNMMKEGNVLQKEEKDDPWFQSIATYLMTLRELRKSLRPCEHIRTSISGSVRSRVESLMESLPSIKSKLSLERFE
jgi:hypothetical protein